MAKVAEIGKLDSDMQPNLATQIFNFLEWNKTDYEGHFIGFNLKTLNSLTIGRI
jgi:hypothetical protein